MHIHYVSEQCRRWLTGIFKRGMHWSSFCSEQKLREEDLQRYGVADLLETFQANSANIAKSGRNGHPWVGACWWSKSLRMTSLSSEVHFSMGQTCCVLGKAIIYTVSHQDDCNFYSFNFKVGNEHFALCSFIAQDQKQHHKKYSHHAVIKVSGFQMDWEPSSGYAKANQKSEQWLKSKFIKEVGRCWKEIVRWCHHKRQTNKNKFKEQ